MQQTNLAPKLFEFFGTSSVWLFSRNVDIF